MARVALTDDNGALYGAPATWLNRQFKPAAETTFTVSETQPTTGLTTTNLSMTSKQVTYLGGKAKYETNAGMQTATKYGALGLGMDVHGGSLLIGVYCLGAIVLRPARPLPNVPASVLWNMAGTRAVTVGFA